MNCFCGTPILWIQPERPAGLGDVLEDHWPMIDESAGGDGPASRVVDGSRGDAGGDTAHALLLRLRGAGWALRSCGSRRAQNAPPSQSVQPHKHKLLQRMSHIVAAATQSAAIRRAVHLKTSKRSKGMKASPQKLTDNPCVRHHDGFGRFAGLGCGLGPSGRIWARHPLCCGARPDHCSTIPTRGNW